MIITTNQMKRIFDKFNDQVSVKYYQKMPRDDWRKIKTAIEDGRMFILNIHGRAYLTFAESYNEPRTMISFERHDSSFGDFLYDLFWGDDKLEMIYCTNDYLDKALWTSTSQEVKEALDKVKLATSDYYNSVQPTAFASQSENISSTSSTTSTTITVGSTGSATTIQVGDYNISSGKAIDGYTITNGTISLTDNIEDTARKVFNEEWNKRKENDKMKFGNFDFGPCTNDNVRMSMYGIAIKNAAGTYVSYDAANGEIIDVDVFNFDGGKYMFKLPVAIKDVKVGDVINHNRTPMFVVGFAENTGDLIAVDIRAGEKKTIMPMRNMFHFDFVTKIVSLFDMNGVTQPSSDMPFGNMLPLMMMSDDNKDMDMKDILMMSMLANGGNMSNMNPMLLYFLASDEADGTSMTDKLLPMLLLSNQQKSVIRYRAPLKRFPSLFGRREGN